MKFRLFLWAPVIVLTAFLASCGSNGIDNSTGRTTSATAATPQSSVAQLSGTLVFSASGTDPANGDFFVAGSLTSDGKGNVTGVEDLNLGSGVDSGVAFTGTYTVDSAKNVTLTLSDGMGTPTFLIFPIPSGSNSAKLNYDGSGTGTVQAQSISNFSNAGTFAFSLNGEGEGTVTGSGNFITGSAGQFASGSENYQDGSYARNTAALGGQLSPAFDGGRGIAVIGPNVFSYYVVSQNQIILAGLEDDSLLYGTAMKQ
jgi:hypothetical protein